MTYQCNLLREFQRVKPSVYRTRTDTQEIEVGESRVFRRRPESFESFYSPYFNSTWANLLLFELPHLNTTYPNHRTPPMGTTWPPIPRYCGATSVCGAAQQFLALFRVPPSAQPRSPPYLSELQSLKFISPSPNILLYCWSLGARIVSMRGLHLTLGVQPHLFGDLSGYYSATSTKHS